jgi:acyl-CoA synthetase (NDP forming)
MLHNKLINPESIAIIGGSNDIHKPGGKLVSNLKIRGFKGSIYIVNPKETEIQGFPCFKSVSNLPPTDLAILAIPALLCVESVEILAKTKNTRGFIIISAGFSEESSQGAIIEKEIETIVNEVGGSLIGPNCIGVINQYYAGVFTLPLPQIDPQGCDFISSSGATAVFIIESAIPKGLTFSSVYSVGNCAQTSAEDILEHFDLTFNKETSSKVKLLYLETIKNPDKLLFHASSLIRKGCKIAAIKAGGSEAGSRAALSHTGALASSDLAVEALFRKAGIVRCFGREELTTVASVFMHKELKGKRIAIITHAGGPAVMLTDALSEGGLEIPNIEGSDSAELLKQLPHGASVKNPIDFLATGTAQHLEMVIDYCDTKFNSIDAIMVIFGSTGLSKVYNAYEVLHNKMVSSSKPIFPILPSIQTAQKEVDCFLAKGHINFPDEVQLARAITRVYNTPKPAESNIMLEGVNIAKSRSIIEQCENGFISSEQTHELLNACGIHSVSGIEVHSREELIEASWKLGFPQVIKVVGPIHKSDVGGVTLNIRSESHLFAEFDRMMHLNGATAVLLQPMLKGTELFVGATYEPNFGHIVMCGLGGIFVEVLGDISSGLAPLTYNEAYSMIRSLKSYKIIQGTRGKKGLPEDQFADIIVRLSSLLRFSTEIKELDLNPLIATETSITVVDARIRVEK